MKPHRILWWAEHLAFAMLGLLAIAGSAAAFVQSYRGLYEWAGRHGLSGLWALFWPLQVDVFIAAGELALFVVIVRQWQRRRMWMAAGVAVIGLAVSVAGNVGHAAHADWVSRATAAVPPLAAALALAVGLAVLKWALADVPPAVPVPARDRVRREPSIRSIRERHGVSQQTAVKMRSYAAAQVAAASNGHG